MGRGARPGLPIICAIESARGVLAAQEIAAAPGVRHLAMGGVDLQRDLNTSGGNAQTALRPQPPRGLLARGGDRAPDRQRLPAAVDDDAELRSQAEFAHSLGFFGKSAIHPRQLPVLHEVFTPSEREVAWAREVLAAFDAAGGAALRLPDGEFVDLPVAQRARRVLQMADALPQLADAVSQRLAVQRLTGGNALRGDIAADVPAHPGRRAQASTARPSATRRKEPPWVWPCSCSWPTPAPTS